VSERTEWKEPSRRDKFHDFWYVATPKIYEWLGWLAILAAIEVVYSKNPAAPIAGLLILGYFSLLFYFGAFFLRHPLRIPGIRNRKMQYALSTLVSIGFAYAANRLAQYAVGAFAVSAP